MFKKLAYKIESHRISESSFWRLLILIKDILFYLDSELPQKLSKNYFYLWKGLVLNLQTLEVRRIFPNFIIIGAMKAGTTSLHNYLKSHPKIFMTYIKEPYFFLDKKNRAASIWDQKLGRQYSLNYLLKTMLKGYEGQRMIGEASTDYTKAPLRGLEVPAKMKKKVPDVKIIYVLRNPLERIVSHYLWTLKNKLPTPPLNEALRIDLMQPLSISLYYYQLSNYLRFFKKEQILVITFEDFVKNPKKILNQIYNFLGVKKDAGYPEEFSIYNKSDNKERFREDDLKFREENYDRLIMPIKEDIKKMENFLGRKLNWDLSKETWCQNETL